MCTDDAMQMTLQSAKAVKKLFSELTDLCKMLYYIKLKALCIVLYCKLTTGPEIIKLFSCLVEHEIFLAHKC